MSFHIDEVSSIGRIYIPENKEKYLFICIIDTSSSMEDNPLLYAYNTLQTVYEKISLKYMNYVSDRKIISFNTNATIWNSIPSFNQLSTGNTNYTDMIEKLINTIANKRCFVILLTDGCDNSNLEYVKPNLIPDLRSKLEITHSQMHVCGFTDMINFDLLYKIYNGFGIFRKTDNEAQIEINVNAILDYFLTRIGSSIVNINNIPHKIDTYKNKGIIDYSNIGQINNITIDKKVAKIVKDKYTNVINEITECQWVDKINNLIYNVQHDLGISLDTITSKPDDIKININEDDFNNLLHIFETGEVNSVLDNNADNLITSAIDIGITTIANNIIDNCIENNIQIKIPSNTETVKHISEKIKFYNSEYAKSVSNNLSNNSIYQEMLSLLGHVNVKNIASRFQKN